MKEEIPAKGHVSLNKTFSNTLKTITDSFEYDIRLFGYNRFKDGFLNLLFFRCSDQSNPKRIETFL